MDPRPSDLNRFAAAQPRIVPRREFGFKLKMAARTADGSAVRTAAKQLYAKLIEIEVESSDDRPTTQQVKVHEESRERAATYKQRLSLLLGKEVADFNALLRQKNVPNVVTNAGTN